MRATVPILVFLLAFLAGGCMQRQLVYLPTHDDVSAIVEEHGLTRWYVDGEYTGYARLVDSPRKIWLFLHGNSGQAGDRAYVLAHLNPADAVYIMEYPGYGDRSGKSSKKTFDRAAAKAFRWLVRKYPLEQVAVLGESLGSGPACELARLPVPPKHIVLVVPFARLEDIAKEKLWFIPALPFMVDRWDNVKALKGYKGRLDIFGALNDTVIPIHHAKALAASQASALFHAVDADHSWARSSEVNLADL